jgi:hypothetical protein
MQVMQILVMIHASVFYVLVFSLLIAKKWPKHVPENNKYNNINVRKLNLNLLTTTIVAPPSNASKWQMGFNSAFKGLTASLFCMTYFSNRLIQG